MTLNIWVNSGTLAPYAATLNHEFIIRDSKCGYLFNLDHNHFAQTDLLMGGYPVKDWKESQLLRLVVQPILSRPLTAIFGFLWGRFIFNIIICGLSVAWLFSILRKRLGKDESLTLTLVAASFPGFSYWGGLPYHYALIAPLSLFTYFELEKFLNSSSSDSKSLKRFCAIIILAGLSYEIFLPIFALILFLALILRKSYKAIFWSIPLIATPSIIINFILSFFVPVLNNNNKSYGNIIKSYFTIPEWGAWWALLKNVPHNLISTFYNSAFFFLPLSFLLFVLLDILQKKNIFKKADALFLISFLALFAFVNLAPPYEGWQMRGDWVARLYMPVFAVYIFYISRSLFISKSKKINLAKTLILATCLAGQLGIVYGGISGWDKLASHSYYQFYKHAPEALYHENLDNFGRWPLGFCKNENKRNWLTRSP
jgi:hypothetical protein